MSRPTAARKAAARKDAKARAARRRNRPVANAWPDMRVSPAALATLIPWSRP